MAYRRKQLRWVYDKIKDGIEVDTEVAVVDADVSSSSPLSLFMHCSRLAAASASTAAIRLQLLDPPTLYEAEVSSRHKPRALDCSGVEYVAAVETALSSMADTKPRFELRWSRQKRTLTLMERSEFAMKFCAIEFRVTESGTNGQSGTAREAAGQKEKLLETALAAKQSTEDCLILGFCAVLNAKKDEIRRLQDELKRKEESDESSKEESDEDMGTEEEEGESKRTKRDAIDAYSHLPANLKPSSVQVSSAEDLLSSMDDIIKNEEEVDEATQRGDKIQVKSEPVAASQESRPRVKNEATRPNPTKPTPPPLVDETMDSEEEDLLDMLS
ncbi:hypothetical protein PInf_004465 [Phytophthora infestans]|nr:hypothetical protein PInf_004465 [Phytophthora infestans]